MPLFGIYYVWYCSIAVAAVAVLLCHCGTIELFVVL